MIETYETRNPSSVDETRNRTPKQKRKLRLMRFVTFLLPLIVIGAAVGGVMVMNAMKSEPEEKEDPIKAIPVVTAMATQGNTTLNVTASGEVQPRTEINIVPQVSGRITYMSPKFTEGGKFNKGDLMVRIEPAEFELRVVQARANVAQAQTALTREQSEAEIAKRDWEELGRAGRPTPLTLREPQMAEAAAQLEAARAQLQEAELQLNRTSVYAPFNGRVNTRIIDQGEFVTAGTRLGQVYATNVMDVRLPMSNQDLRQAGLSLGFDANGGKGVPVTLSANVAGRYSQWQGHIVRTDSRFDTQSRVLYAYAEVRDPFGKGADDGTPLAPGIFVEASIEGQKLDNVVFVPRTALRGENQIYVVRGEDELEIKDVTVLSSNRKEAIISDGLEPGTAVITSPIRGVADGMKIEVVSAARMAGATNEAAETGGQP